MPKAKVSPNEADDQTLLRRITGVGPSTLCTLANCGYSFKPSSTLGDFKKATISFAELQKKLSGAGISGGYTLPKLKSLWGGGGGGNNKRVRDDDDQGSTKRRKLLEEGGDIKKDDPDQNFLLEPKLDAPTGEVEKEDKPEETPEIDALHRKPEENAMAIGDVAPKVSMSVIPDVTLNISPDDKGINGPSEVMPTDPVPIIPGAALGPVMAQVRHVAPQTLEEKQGDQQSAEDLPSVSANGSKDIGGDGYGALLTEGRVGKDQPSGDNAEEEEEVKEAGVVAPSRGGKKFTSKALEIASIPKFNDSDKVKPFDIRTASRHPFQQSSLFRNHDMNVKVSKLINKTHENNSKKQAAAAEAIGARQDLSWTRYNASTEGLAMAQMPLGSSNFLMRGPMVSEYQLFGPNPMRPVFPPSPFINEQLSGRFR